MNTISLPSGDKSPMMTNETLLTKVTETLDDLKAADMTVLEVSGLNALVDHMVIVSGTSSRHVKALADKLMKALKTDKIKPCKMEADTENEWVLIDIGDIIVHIMHPRVRDFYNLESLWTTPAVTHTEAHAVA